MQILDYRAAAAEKAAFSGQCLVGRLTEALPQIEARAARADESGRFPADDISLLRSLGLLRAFAAADQGGARFDDRADRVDCLFDCLRLIGAANLSLGRIFEGHVNAIVLIERYGHPRALAALRRSLAAGALFGVWNTEGPPGVALSAGSGGWSISGSKTYATGAGHLDYAIVTARLPDGQKQMLVLPVGEETVRADSSPWKTSGMRATVSGRYDCSAMAVGEDLFVGRPGDYEREPLFTAGAWRFTAVQLGAIEALTGLLRSHLRQSDKAADPVQRARFGRAVAAARTAHQWVRHAARRAEIDPDATAAPLVLMTRGVVEEAGLAVIQAVQRGVGTRAFFSDSPIDRIMRDLELYLRQPSPDLALDHAASAWLDRDCWGGDPWW